MSNRIEPYFRDTYSVVYVTQESFDYLLSQDLVTPANRWSGQVRLPKVKYLGYDGVRCLAYALASEDFIQKRSNLEKSLADALELIEKLRETLNPPEPLYMLKRYVPHTEKTFREANTNLVVNSREVKSYSVYRSGLRIRVGWKERTHTWEELFTTATTPNGQPFGQLVSDVVIKSPTPQEPTPSEPDFL